MILNNRVCSFKQLRISILIITFFGFNYGLIKAQEGVPVYLDYLSDNYYLIFPSMAGANYGGKVRLTARQQWFDQNEAPNLQTLSGHARLGDRSGVGAILFNDANGYHSQTGLYLTYAHHLNFWRAGLNQLSFGLSIGTIQSQLDESDFDPSDFDPVIAGIKQSTAYFNIDLGLSYFLEEFYAHLAIKNLLFANRNINSDIESNNQRKYLFTAGYVFEIKETWLLEPSGLFQWTELTNEKALDANLKGYRKMDWGMIWAGISYRHNFDLTQYVDGETFSNQRLELISPIIGVNYKQFMFGYTYSYQIGSIQFDSGGFHQITLGLDFWESKKPYECNCPLINN